MSTHRHTGDLIPRTDDGEDKADDAAAHQSVLTG